MKRDAPRVFVKVGDGNRSARVDMSTRLMRFTYEDKERGADSITLEIDNRDLLQHDNPIFRKGNVVEVTWGYPGRMAPARFGIIKKVTGFDVLTVEAKGLEVMLNENARSRTFSDKTRSEVVTQIAEENGFGEQSRFIQVTDEKCEVITQAGLTDAQLVRRLATKEGFEFFIDFDGWHWHERHMNQEVSRELEWFTGATGDIKSISLDNDITKRPIKHRVKCRDKEKKITENAFADNERAFRQGLAQKFEAPTAIVRHRMALAQIHLQRQTPVNLWLTPCDFPGAAKRAADRRFRKEVQSTVKMTLVVVGDPLCIAKTVFNLSGVGKRLSGRYYIKSVTHEIGDGYTCTLKAISDGHNGYRRTGFEELTGDPEELNKAKSNIAQITYDPESPVSLALKERFDQDVATQGFRVKYQWIPTKRPKPPLNKTELDKARS